MVSEALLRRLPGTRIQGYRNSMPRNIKLIATGPKSDAMLQLLHFHGRDNIVFSKGVNLGAARRLDAAIEGVLPHAVIVVHQQGDMEYFPYLIEKTTAMLSLVVVETVGTLHEKHENITMRKIRALADVFATTSDYAFVEELVESLAA